VFHLSYRSFPIVYTLASHSVLAHRTLKKAAELTEESRPVHSKSNIKLNSSFYLSFMYITGKKIKRSPQTDR
jgi:hypothetical protein